jgi:anti-sigma regulatory factor (Ser/Thr protein kinase)
MDKLSTNAAPILPCATMVPITDSSQIGEARRQANRIAEEAGFSEADRGKASIVVSELATNIARHASSGEILLQSVEVGNRKWIDILSVDRGPGIADVGRSLQDGFSTGGTSGTGLGAARRLASEFDIYSAQPSGTVVFCRVVDQPLRTYTPRPFYWAVFGRPAPLETECGDAWRIAERNGSLALMLVDGLGHGHEAAKAAAEAVCVFDRDPFVPLTEFFGAAHARMHGTRGAAMAAIQMDAASRQIKYAGVGNIAGHLHGSAGERGRGLFSHNGIVGVQIRKVQEFHYEYPASGLLIMHSDGLQSRWSLDVYPGLAQRHPGVIAGVLYRDFTRGRDDVTVAAIRLSQP